MHFALLFAGALCLLAAPASAQMGTVVIPSLSVAETYDDNIFSAPDDSTAGRLREDDLITQFTPALGLSWGGERSSLSAQYSLTSEIYAEHSDLDSVANRQSATAGGAYQATRSFTTSLSGGYSESKNPRDLNAITPTPAGIPTVVPGTPPAVTAPSGNGLEGRRARSQQVFVQPQAAYLLSRLTTLDGGYGFTQSEQRGGSTNRVHTANAGAHRSFTSNDTGNVRYQFRTFDFSRDGRVAATPGLDRSPDTHVITVGWQRAFTRAFSASIDGGGRFQDGSVAPEAGAQLSYQLRRGAVGLSYQRTQTTTLGEAGTSNSDLAALSIAYNPVRELGLTLSQSAARSTREGSEVTNAYRTSFRATYPLAGWLSLVLSYEFSLQDGSQGFRADTEELDDRRHRNLVTVSVLAQAPFRLF